LKAKRTTKNEKTRPRLLVSFCVLSFAFCVALQGCSSGPEPVYEGPRGQGRLRYDPKNGIVREGTQAGGSEQKLFEAAQLAFEQRRFEECIAYCEQLTILYPEGSHAVDAILLRMNARIEGPRQPALPAPARMALSDWLFLYLTPSYDSRFMALVNRGGEYADKARTVRELPYEKFMASISVDADAIFDAGALGPLVQDLHLLVTYYVPALDIREYRIRTAEIGRDVAWIAYAARDYDLALDAAAELNSLNPPPGIKADALFVQGNSEAKNGGYPLAVATFERLFKNANLHDTDTRWRPYALYQLIVQTANTAKGPEYDIAVYERCLEYFGDYELYLIENPSVPKSLREKFRVLIAEVYQVFIDRDLSAAKTYRKIGEKAAAAYYEKHAEEWRAQMDTRLKKEAERS
jgi:tetratricopeptide (TPR) repeat protein